MTAELDSRVEELSSHPSALSEPIFPAFYRLSIPALLPIQEVLVVQVVSIIAFWLIKSVSLGVFGVLDLSILSPCLLFVLTTGLFACLPAVWAGRLRPFAPFHPLYLPLSLTHTPPHCAFGL